MLNVNLFLADYCAYGPAKRCKSVDLFEWYQQNGGELPRRTFINVAKACAPRGVKYGVYRFFDGVTCPGFVGIGANTQTPACSEDPSEARFIGEMCEFVPHGRTKSADLYRVYAAWAGFNARPRKSFTAAVRPVMEAHGARYGVHRSEDGPHRGFVGVRLTSAYDEAQIIPTHVTCAVAAEIIGLPISAVHTAVKAGGFGEVVRRSPRKTMVAFDALDNYTGAPGRTLRLRMVCDLLVSAANRSLDEEQRRDLADLRRRLRAMRMSPVADWLESSLYLLDALELEAVAEPGLLPAVQVMRTLV